MKELYKLTLPAILRLVAYLVPIGLGALFTWFASQGWGVWNEAEGTLTITLSVAEITAAVVAFIGAPTLAITALWAGWKSRKDDQPVVK